MAHRHTDTFSRPNDTYLSIRDQLERQTSALINERNSVNVQRPSNTYFPPFRNLQGSPQSKISQEHYYRASSTIIDPNKKAEIKHKIKEIIDLCRDQNAAVTRDVNGVMETQKGIYNLLQQTEFDQTRLPLEPHAPVAPNPNAPYTPIRAHEEPIHPGRALQKDIRSILQQNRHIQLSEQALQLIEQIQRRSLAEIQKLRDEKLAISGQLNEEIRRGNIEKKRIAELERQLDFYRKNQATTDPKYELELRSRIAYLENLLQQSAKTGEFPDFNLLYAQGQAIRQDTIRLLKLKEAKLLGEDEEKKRLREQVARLQRRVDQLQQQRSLARGKPSYGVIDEDYSPIAPNNKRKDSHRNSANQYQSLVMEMRKITSN